MINKETITIKLNKNTIKQLNQMKLFNGVDNMTTYCKNILTKIIDDDYKKLQERITQMTK